MQAILPSLPSDVRPAAASAAASQQRLASRSRAARTTAGTPATPQQPPARTPVRVTSSSSGAAAAGGPAPQPAPTRTIASALSVHRHVRRLVKRAKNRAEPAPAPAPDPIHRAYFMASLLLQPDRSQRVPSRPKGTPNKMASSPAPRRPPHVSPWVPKDWAEVLAAAAPPAATASPTASAPPPSLHLPSSTSPSPPPSAPSPRASAAQQALTARAQARSHMYGRKAVVTPGGLLRADHLLTSPPDARRHPAVATGRQQPGGAAAFDPEGGLLRDAAHEALASTAGGKHFRVDRMVDDPEPVFGSADVHTPMRPPIRRLAATDPHPHPRTRGVVGADAARVLGASAAPLTGVPLLPPPAVPASDGDGDGVNGDDHGAGSDGGAGGDGDGDSVGSHHTGSTCCSDEACACHCDCGSDVPRFYGSESDGSEPEFDDANHPVGYESHKDVLASRAASRYLTACAKLHTTPDASGLSLDPAFSDAAVVDLSSSGLGMRFLKSVASSMAAMATMKHLDLARNRLDDKCIELLVGCLPPNLLTLGLAQNKIRTRGAHAIAAALPQRSWRPSRLDLSGNALGAAGANAVLAANAVADKLCALHLGGCGLDARCSDTLYRTLVECAVLQELGLGWNRLNAAVAALGHGLRVNEALKVLDLSWNGLGRPSAVATAAAPGGSVAPSDVARDSSASTGLTTLLDALQVNACLTHLDVSNNQLDAPACTRLAAALQHNHTIVGLHVSGNECAVDELGFVVAGDTSDASMGHTSTSIVRCGPPTAPGGVPTAAVRRMGVCRNCWLCEGWVPTVFRYIPGESGPGGSRITVHCSHDGWAAHVLTPESISPPNSHRTARQRRRRQSLAGITATLPTMPPIQRRTQSETPYTSTRQTSMDLPGDDSDGSEEDPLEGLIQNMKNAPPQPSFNTTIVVPPGEMEYVFVVDGSHHDALDHPARPTKSEKTVLRLGVLRPSSHRFVETPGPAVVHPGDKLADAPDAETGLTWKLEKELELKRYLPPHAVVNFRTVRPREPDAGAITVQPRKLPHMTEVIRRTVDTSFDRHRSVFAQCVAMTADGMHQRFDIDFQRSKCSKVVKEEEELYRVRRVLTAHFEPLCRIFRDCAAESGKDVTQIGWAGFAQLLKTCRIPDEKHCNLKALDSIFIVSNVEKPGVTLKNNNSRALMRHEFLEALLRTAVAKFVNSGLMTSTAEALEKLIVQYLLPHAKQSNVEEWRNQRLYNSGIDVILKKNLSMLFALFCGFAETVRMGRRRTTLSLERFVDMIDSADLVKDRPHLTRLAFARSKQFVADDQGSPLVKALTFVEFLEALCHLAELRDESAGAPVKTGLTAMQLSMAATLAKAKLRGRRASEMSGMAAAAAQAVRNRVQADAKAAVAAAKPLGASVSKDADTIRNRPARRQSALGTSTAAGGRVRSASVDSDAARAVMAMKMLPSKVAAGSPAVAADYWQKERMPLSVKLLPVLDALRVLRRKRGDAAVDDVDAADPSGTAGAGSGVSGAEEP